jgi:hypothetical protein
VDRVLEQQAIFSLPDNLLLLELQEARTRNAELQAALSEVQHVDEAELQRLWDIIGKH